MENITNNTNTFMGNFKEKIISVTPYGTENFLASSNEFLSSNTLIAKAAFLLLIIILFVVLFFIISRVMIHLMTPDESPYIIKGMKDATQSLTIPQTFADVASVPIYRSKNEYDGIEFTYSFWMYVNDLVYNENKDFKHIFHKGSTLAAEGEFDGVYGPNNCPGVYLYTGKKNLSDNLLEKFPLLGMLVRLNVYHDGANKSDPHKYFEDIYIDGLPIKKWVNIVIRVTSQNVVDIYVNGTLMKRHKLSNVVKQNYDNLYVNLNGGFSGNLSNLKYYNYAIGTFEIDNLASRGPDLKIAKNNSLEESKPHYLSSQWYFDDTDPLR